MRFLLDTCTFLWITLEPPRLSLKAIGHFIDPANQFWLSSVSAWEVALAHSLGRLSLFVPPSEFVPMQRKNHDIELLPLGEEAALHLSSLPNIHRDPFDRMLVCQAKVHDLTLLTPDPQIRQYPVRVEW